MTYYEPLNVRGQQGVSSHSPRLLRAVCIVSIILNLWFLWQTIERAGPDTVASVANRPHVYSPAEDIVADKLVKFTRGFAKDVPIYERRPSNAVDAAWQELWSVAPIKISRSMAMKMPNKTWPLWGPSSRGEYLISLDVFHQIHCLDILRKQLYPRYNESHVNDVHVRHCIGAIRQALMCSADTTPVIWQWSEKLQEAEQRDDVVHVCRDYHRIRDWASERTVPDEEIDFRVHVEDDLTSV
ncbi:hypothetical protein MSAN_00487900 [Mycena sanguinolenta]|uniref:Cyclochlorotine biosynthesis protein O n=1 Tax=Mycena sanguinolenta TaxID=230812 RepID=A0A8H7DET7_9AGAR|nr:hypothetical protein MSAN_00487900 [Mycena sanguinolenta]